jgi:hypothetical protein
LCRLYGFLDGLFRVFEMPRWLFISSTWEGREDRNQIRMRIIGRYKGIEIGDDTLGYLGMAVGWAGVRDVLRRAFDMSYPLFET